MTTRIEVKVNSRSLLDRNRQERDAQRYGLTEVEANRRISQEVKKRAKQKALAEAQRTRINTYDNLRRVRLLDEPAAWRKSDGPDLCHARFDNNNKDLVLLTWDGRSETRTPSFFGQLPDITNSGYQPPNSLEINESHLFALPVGGARQLIIWSQSGCRFCFSRTGPLAEPVLVPGSKAFQIATAFRVSKRAIAEIPIGVRLGEILYSSFSTLPSFEILETEPFYNSDGELIARNFETINTTPPGISSFVYSLQGFGYENYFDGYTPGIYTAIDYHQTYVENQLNNVDIDYGDLQWALERLQGAPIPQYRVTPTQPVTGEYFEIRGPINQEITEETHTYVRKSGRKYPFLGYQTTTYHSWDWGAPDYCLQKLEALGFSRQDIE